MCDVTDSNKNGDSVVVNIFVQVEECDDTDSNKTEVEEIEMVDMEGRAEVNTCSKTQTYVNLFLCNSIYLLDDLGRCPLQS